MPTASHARRWPAAYSSASGALPTRIAVRCGFNPRSARAATLRLTSVFTSCASALPSMIFADMESIIRGREYHAACMKIYTRTGDDGTTGLIGGGRVAKDDASIECYGTVDELNAFIGV